MDALPPKNYCIEPVQLNATTSAPNQTETATGTVEENVKVAYGLVCQGNFESAQTIYLNLRNQADQCKLEGKKTEHDQIYYQLLDLAIQFQLENVNGQGAQAASAIYSGLKLSHSRQDPLNNEATIRQFLCHHPQHVNSGAANTLIAKLAETAMIPGRPWACYELGRYYEMGNITVSSDCEAKEVAFHFNCGPDQDYSEIAQKYVELEFTSYLGHHLSAIHAYTMAANDESFLAKVALSRLCATITCPILRFRLALAVDSIAITDLPPNYGQALKGLAIATIQAYGVINDHHRFFEYSVRNKAVFISFYTDNGFSKELGDFLKKLNVILLSQVQELKNKRTGETEELCYPLMDFWKQGKFVDAISRSVELCFFLMDITHHEAIKLWGERDMCKKTPRIINRTLDEDHLHYPMINGKIRKIHRNETFKTKPLEAVI